MAKSFKLARPEHLKRFRELLGLSQEKAARRLEVARVTWNRWENGRSPLPGDILDRLRAEIRRAKDDGEIFTA